MEWLQTQKLFRVKHSFFIGIILLFSACLKVHGIANRAAYYIQNVYDGSCITGGPVEDSNKPGLFKKGVVLTSNCSHDLKQQWVLNETGFETYHLRSFNSKDMNQLLNAQVVGEFIKYFPGPIEIRQDRNITKETRNNFYKLMFETSATKGCYTSMGRNHVLYLDQCNDNASSQLWNLSLVNEPPPKNCTSFWACNASK